MKKSLLMTLSALMLGTLMLTGCGTEKTETTAQTSAETTTQTETDSAVGDVKGASGEITVVSREDGSGTRGAFVELLGIEEEVDGEKMDMTTEDAKITNRETLMRLVTFPLVL